MVMARLARHNSNSNIRNNIRNSINNTSCSSISTSCNINNISNTSSISYITSRNNIRHRHRQVRLIGDRNGRSRMGWELRRRRDRVGLLVVV
jgi:hypothetical protein